MANAALSLGEPVSASLNAVKSFGMNDKLLTHPLANKARHAIEEKFVANPSVKAFKEGALGEYYGVANRSELSSRAVWTGTPVSTFGNAFVRHDEMEREYETEELADRAISWLVESATLLSVELQGIVPEEETHVIP